MEASDMLDVIHYLFEEDLHYEVPESETRKTETRKRLYREYYNTKYLYGVDRSSPNKNNMDFDSFDEEDENDQELDMDIKPFSPKDNPTKPYTPPTPFNENSEKPFGIDLDAPLK